MSDYSDLERSDDESINNDSEDDEFVDETDNETLDNYEMLLLNSLTRGEIDDYSYQVELLMIKYKQLLKHNTFELNDEDKAKLERLKKYKKLLENEFVKIKLMNQILIKNITMY